MLYSKFLLWEIKMVNPIDVQKIVTNFPQSSLILHPKTRTPGYYLDSSEQLIDILCGGPWIPARQNQVKKAALEWYRSLNIKDLRDLNIVEIGMSPYPLLWQKKLLHNIVATCQISFYTFNQQVEKWRLDYDSKRATLDFFDFCGVNESGTKITWIFVRDHLGHDGYPIDRWVRRGLKYFDLPLNSHYIIEACNQGGINVSKFNADIKTFARINKLTG